MEENINNTEVTTEETQTEEVRTYSEEEVADLLQRESDRRVTEALKKAEKKYQRELSLSQLDEKERASAEKDNLIKDLEEKIDALNRANTKTEVLKTLAGRGLPADFADLIELGDDVKIAQGRVESLAKAFERAVEAKAREMVGETAKTPQRMTTATETMTREQFFKLPLREQQRIYDSDRELYEKLTRR